MVYCITEMGVYEADTLEHLKKKVDLDLKKEDFKFFGPDQVINLTSRDVDFVQDRKQLSSIMFHNFFRKDPRPTIFFLVTISVLVISLIFSINIYNLFKFFVESFNLG